MCLALRPPLLLAERLTLMRAPVHLGEVVRVAPCLVWKVWTSRSRRGSCGTFRSVRCCAKHLAATRHVLIVVLKSLGVGQVEQGQLEQVWQVKGAVGQGLGQGCKRRLLHRRQQGEGEAGAAMVAVVPVASTRAASSLTSHPCSQRSNEAITCYWNSQPKTPCAVG